MSGPKIAPDIDRIRKELQQIITSVMGDGLPSIPFDVPILDLGVGSLALVEGMRQVYDRFGVLVSIRRVIEGQVTIGSLALYIEQELNSQGSSKRQGQGDRVTERQVEREIPIAPSQQHLAFLSRYSAEAGAAFHEALAVRLSGAMHGPALHAALEEVGRRYEALRTALNPDGNSLQVCTGEALELIVSTASDDEWEERLSGIVRRPFEQGSRLFRAELLRLAETEHLLVLVGHALVVDQQALIIVLNDIAGLYTAYARDQEAGAPPAVLQWTDYLSMGETPEAKEARRSAERYWSAAFAAGASRSDLPTDRPRPAVKRYAGSRVDLQLPGAVHQQLRSLAASEGLAPDSLLFGAFSILLHRLSDTAHLVLGVESEPLYPDAGLPVVAQTHNMLAPRTEYDPRRSFQGHLRSAAQLLAEANSHRHLSLGELIQILHVPRDQSRSAVFGSAFRSWAEPSLPRFESLQATYVLPPSSGARYDLEMIAVTSDNATRLVFDFSSELFDAATILRWLGGMASLLETGLQKPNEPCGLLPLMSAAEREQVVVRWNETEASFPREQTVLDSIAGQAKQRPDRVAIRFGASSLTYTGLMERVETVAHALRKAGVTKGDRVGILMRRSLDLIPAMLAAWRIGAMDVPMDIGFPAKRIAGLLEDAEPRAVLTNEDLASLLDEKHRALAVLIEQVKQESSAGGAFEPASGSDSAHIIYTSGSTGRPKGVEIRHRALLNVLLATRDYLKFAAGNSMLALTTISFDISATELIMPLMAGGTVDLAEDGLAADGLQLKERIEQRRPSHVQATPSTWKSVLTAGWEGSREICLASAGEALSRDLAEQLLPRCGALWNLYGPTETTVYSSASPVRSAPGEPIRIGSPLPNTRVYILDREYQPVPVGAIGELYIGGEGVAAGYWHRPELTRERFLENPFVPGDRMYRTGDLARFLPDGQIICLGRADDQVKIHGVRVEPGEIETVLRGLPGVQDAAVTSWIDPRGDRQLVAHVIAAGRKTLSSLQIRTELRAQLPEVMIPPHILFTDSFPHTANGKVHRAALPNPEELQPASTQAPREAPSTSTERELARIWGTLLHVDAGIIGRDSDFMDLGGHSLLMTVLMIEVRKVFQISFSLREFFGASTLRKCAALIDDRRRQATLAAADRARLASSRTAEWARQRMLYLQREAELPAYLAPARGLTYRPPAE
ncbi:MAG TPA: amino acid adenylation domain-containing protein, partial [Anaerolineales bacterium]